MCLQVRARLLPAPHFLLEKASSFMGGMQMHFLSCSQKERFGGGCSGEVTPIFQKLLPGGLGSWRKATTDWGRIKQIGCLTATYCFSALAK